MSIFWAKDFWATSLVGCFSNISQIDFAYWKTYNLLNPIFLSAPFHFVQLLSLEEAWTLILDDALANSFVAPTTDDLKEDNQVSCKFSKLDIKLYFVQKKFIFS